MTHDISMEPGGLRFRALANETLLSAAMRQGEYIACGMASLDRAREANEYIDADTVSAGLQRKLHKARREPNPVCSQNGSAGRASIVVPKLDDAPKESKSGISPLRQQLLCVEVIARGVHGLNAAQAFGTVMKQRERGFVFAGMNHCFIVLGRQ
jgi:hypothetical protein